MMSMRLGASVLALMTHRCLAMSLVGRQQQLGTDVTDHGYDVVAALRDDVAMAAMVKRILAAEGKFIPKDQDGELAGFVPWFSGTKASQGLALMRQELSSKTWVKDLKVVDGASLSEADYQAVAALHNDTAMKLFAHALLRGEASFVPPAQEEELSGFVQWFSGTKAVQSLENMRAELAGKPWVQKLQTVGGTAEAFVATKSSRNVVDADANHTLREEIAVAAEITNQKQANATAEQVKRKEADAGAGHGSHEATNATAFRVFSNETGWMKAFSSWFHLFQRRVPSRDCIECNLALGLSHQ